MNHWATPPKIAKAKAAQGDGQQQLGFKTMIGPHEFTRAGTLHAVAKLIATNNQVSYIILVNITLTNDTSLSHLQIMLPSVTALSR